MTRLSKFVLGKLAQGQGRASAHADANLLAAFAEQRLSEPERGEVMAHLSECPGCREILAFTTGVEAPLSEQSPRHKLAGRRLSWRGYGAAIAATLACLALLLIPRLTDVRRPPSVAMPAQEGTPLSSLLADSTTVRNLSEERPAQEPKRSEILKRTEPTARVRLRPKALEARIAPPSADLSIPALSSAEAASRESKGSAFFTQAPASIVFVPPPVSVQSLVSSSAAMKDGLSLNVTSSASLQSTPPGKLALDPQPSAQRSKGLLAFKQSAFAKNQEAGAFRALAVSASSEKSLWSIGAPPYEGRSKGAIQKSDDGGKTWREVRVSDRAQLYALSSAGRDVWVGGADGALYHSADDGLHWDSLAVVENGTRIIETITRIDVFDGAIVKLKVASGAALISADGGRHWRRE